MPLQRSFRFGDSTSDLISLKNFSQSGLSENLTPFFGGKNVDKRMNKIRSSIVYIRNNWDKFDEFMFNLNNLFVEQNRENENLLSGFIGERKSWIDRPFPDQANNSENDDYDAIRLYASERGYNEIFSLMNLAFRSTAKVFDEIVDEVVFLVELLNIDLYNYNFRDPRVSQFSSHDIVYRGMCVGEKEIEDFAEICRQDIDARYISIPLGFMSSSLDQRKADEFISSRIQQDPSLFPLLWKIHIISLEPELLQQYHERFPQSVVSPICATRIYDLSDFPDEKEVLLRGPFFQVLDFYTDGEIQGKALNILEAVMLDSNRDHPSTAELRDDDECARSLFKSIVNITRNNFCLSYSTEKQNKDDIDVYLRRRQENEENFRRLTRT